MTKRLPIGAKVRVIQLVSGAVASRPLLGPTLFTIDGYREAPNGLLARLSAHSTVGSYTFEVPAAFLFQVDE